MYYPTGIQPSMGQYSSIGDFLTTSSANSSTNYASNLGISAGPFYTNGSYGMDWGTATLNNIQGGLPNAGYYQGYNQPNFMTETPLWPQYASNSYNTPTQNYATNWGNSWSNNSYNYNNTGYNSNSMFPFGNMDYTSNTTYYTNDDQLRQGLMQFYGGYNSPLSGIAGAPAAPITVPPLPAAIQPAPVIVPPPVNNTTNNAPAAPLSKQQEIVQNAVDLLVRGTGRTEEQALIEIQNGTFESALNRLASTAKSSILKQKANTALYQLQSLNLSDQQTLAVARTVV